MTTSGPVAVPSAVPAQSEFFSPEDLLSVQDTRYDEVAAWGVKFRLGSLTAGEILEFVETNEGPMKRTAGIRLVISSWVDKNGNRLGRPEHLEQFKKRDAKTVTSLINAVLKLNGLEKKDEVASAKND